MKSYGIFRPANDHDVIRNRIRRRVLGRNPKNFGHITRQGAFNTGGIVRKRLTNFVSKTLPFKTTNDYLFEALNRDGVCHWV